MKSTDIMKKLQEVLPEYELPEDFAEGFEFEKDEIINPDVIDEEDLVDFGDMLLAYDTMFEDLSLFAILSENQDKCMFLVTTGDLNPDEVVKKGIIKL